MEPNVSLRISSYSCISSLAREKTCSLALCQSPESWKQQAWPLESFLFHTWVFLPLLKRCVFQCLLPSLVAVVISKLWNPEASVQILVFLGN